MRHSPIYIFLITIKYRLASLFRKKPKGGYYLFLDDQRIPDRAFKFTGETEYVDFRWTVARNYNQFVKTVTKRGLPILISYDHDLGLEHTRYFFDNGGYANPPDPLKANFKEKHGYDAAKFISDFCIDNNLKLPDFRVHSRNPCGRDNIIHYLSNHIKHLETNKR